MLLCIVGWLWIVNHFISKSHLNINIALRFIYIFFQWMQWHFFWNRDETDFSWGGPKLYVRDNNWWGFVLYLLYTQQRPTLCRLQHPHLITLNRDGNPGVGTTHNHSGMTWPSWAQEVLPVVLKPKSRGQDTAKASTHTAVIMSATRRQELCPVPCW